MSAAESVCLLKAVGDSSVLLGDKINRVRSVPIVIDQRCTFRIVQFTDWSGHYSCRSMSGVACEDYLTTRTHVNVGEQKKSQGKNKEGEKRQRIRNITVIVQTSSCLCPMCTDLTLIMTPPFHPAKVWWKKKTRGYYWTWRAF